jgi:hypothetical protein
MRALAIESWDSKRKTILRTMRQLWTSAQPEASYPTAHEKLIGRKVWNADVPGEVSAALLKKTVPCDFPQHKSQTRSCRVQAGRTHA